MLKEMKNKRAQLKRISIILSILIVLTLALVLAVPSTTHISPVNGTTLTYVNSSIPYVINFSTTNGEGIYDIKFVTNKNGFGENFSLYKNAIILYNFENKSSIGESDVKAVSWGKVPYNATIVGATPTINGKYGGGLRFDGNNDYLNLSYIYRPAETTISFWMNITSQSATYADIIRCPNWIGMETTSTASGAQFSFKNATGSSFSNIYDLSFSPIGEWVNVIITVDTTGYRIYRNGVLNLSGNMQGGLNASYETCYMMTESFSKYVGATLDDFTILNVSSSYDEVQQIYSSSLMKHDSNNYSYYSNQTLNYSSSFLNSLNPTYNVNSQLCVSNSTMSENCSSINTLILTIPNKNMIANFTTKIGDIRDDFYGVALQSPKMVSGSIDTNCDGTSETPRNYTWQQETLLNSGATYEYMDANLGTYYNGVENPGFEFWRNSALLNSTGFWGQRAWGWNGYGGLISNSTDAHSGLYSINMTGANVPETYMYFEANEIQEMGLINDLGASYTFSVWAKGSGTFRFWLKVRSPGYPMVNYSDFTLTNNWTQYNITYTVSNISYEYYVGFAGISQTEWVLIDDFSMTKNGNPYTWWRIGNTENISAQLTWDYEHNITSTTILSYMPRFLANRTSKCIDSESDTDYNDCMAYNPQIFADISLDYYKRIDQYRNVTRCQIWNEPEIGFFQDNLASGSAKTDFVNLFNTTYVTFENYNSNIEIAGWRGAQSVVTTSSLQAFTQMMISNLSSLHKDFSFHPYEIKFIGYPLASDKLDYLFSQCAVYGAECSHIYLDEYNAHDGTTADILKNKSNGQSKEYKINIAYFLQDLLNSYPANVTAVPYHWDDSVGYFTCPSRYPEYPSKYSSVSEAGLDNATSPVYYPTYTIPQLVSRYCEAGDGEVYQSSADSGLVSLICKNGEDYNIIAMNILDYSLNGTINVSGTGITNLKDSNGNNYPVSGGIVQLGILDSSKLESGNGGLLFLDSDLQALTITIESPTANYNYSSNTTYFNVSLNEEGSWCGYSLDGSANVTMVKQGVIFDFKAVNSTMSDKLHTVVFTCNDTSNNFNSTSIQFRTDVNLPTGFLVRPENNTYNSSTTLNLTANISDPAGIKNATIYVYNQSGFFNSTVFTFASNVVNTVIGAVQNFVDGVYNWFVTVFDWVGNSYTTVNNTLVVDTTFPQINFTNPTPGSSSSSNSIYVNYTTSDLNDVYSFIDFDSSLVGWWRMEGNANDDLGINNGSITGATLVSNGRFGQGYEFDSVDDYIDLGALGINKSDSWSFSAWFNSIDIPANDEGGIGDRQCIFRYNGDGNMFCINNNDRDLLLTARDSGSYNQLLTTTLNLQQDIWYHGVVVQNSSTHSIYVNGIYIMSGTHGEQVETSDDFKIGGGDSNYEFNGTIDDVLIFNRSLSQEEITALYNATQTYHNFTDLDEGSHSFTAYSIDQAGNKNLTELKNILVDTIIPTVNITFPPTGTNYPNFMASVLVEINFTTNDTNLNNCKYELIGPYNVSNTTTDCSNGANNFTMNIVSAGSFTVKVYSEDYAGNENMSTINFTVSAYSGPASGGGSSLDPQNTEEQASSEIDANYNRSLICQQSKAFKDLYGANYTTEEFNNFEHQLELVMGKAIDSNLLKLFIDDYSTMCAEFIETPVNNQTPGTNTDTFNYIPLIIFIGIIVLLVLIILVAQARNSSQEITVRNVGGM